MLERVWQKRNPPTLFVGRKINAVTMEKTNEKPKMNPRQMEVTKSGK